MNVAYCKCQGKPRLSYSINYGMINKDLLITKNNIHMSYKHRTHSHTPI